MQLFNRKCRSDDAESSGFQERGIGLVEIILQCISVTAFAALFFLTGEDKALFLLHSLCIEVDAMDGYFICRCLSKYQ